MSIFYINIYINIMNNFVQYLLIVIMIHFVSKRVLIDMDKVKENNKILHNTEDNQKEDEEQAKLAMRKV